MCKNLHNTTDENLVMLPPEGRGLAIGKHTAKQRTDIQLRQNIVKVPSSRTKMWKKYHNTFDGVDPTIHKLMNARDLHTFLELGKDFSNWIKDRIVQYGFVENIDYVVFAKIGENPRGGRPTKDYFLSLDMAKELSMVERNEKGKTCY